MPQLIWTPAALRDVKRLHRFLASTNPRAALDAVGAIRRHAAILTRQPRVGRRAAYMSEAFRELLIPFGTAGYIALYRVDDQSVSILAVRHQREAGY